MTDEFFMVNTGGDVAFLSGTLKHLIANGWVDEAFIAAHTGGYAEMEAGLDRLEWPALEAAAGVSRERMLEFATMVAQAKSAVFVWSMGVTQHTSGEDNVRAIINLALSRGFVGREGCGLMPIRGHSGVQGGAEMGAYSTVLPGGATISAEAASALSERWGFEVPGARGLTAPEMIDAAHEGKLDVLFSAGGNFIEVLPDPGYTEAALARVPLRVHMDIVLSGQMLVDPADAVLLLPAATRYEIAGGVTETSTERRVIFSPEIPGPRPPEARAEWEVFGDLAARVRPELGATAGFSSTAAIRAEIAREVPGYGPIADLAREGDSFQYGGSRLCEGWVFPTADGRAHFSTVGVPATGRPEGSFLVATRRGKQFNSMVHEERDPLNRAGRDAVLMAAPDAARLGLKDGDQVTLRSAHGELPGRVFLAPVTAGNLQVHWPEAEVLIDRRRRSPEAGIPDYNAVVTVDPSRGPM
jgi:molybdopterin-dependent oxidoreductase alpha subunit